MTDSAGHGGPEAAETTASGGPRQPDPGPHRHRPQGRPPWWPAGEPWPPVDDGTWPGMRRGFLWRIGCLAGAVLSVGTLGLLVLVWHVASALGLSAGGAGGVAMLTTFAVIVLVGLALAGRTVRRFAVPFGDLIEAAGRVESGDYTARVRERPFGPLPVRALVRAFNGMAARLERDERQRRTLLADISHELRTPLSVVQGEIEAMLDGVHAPDEQHLGAALDETRVLARLIEDLRTLALAEAGTLALHREATDATVLVEEVVRAFGPTAEAAGVSIVLDLDDDAPLIEIDPVRIRQVLSNVLANGLRYAPRGSTVGVGLHVGDSRRSMRFAVEDEGPGIPPELRAHVFERFAKSTESRGSGLGLAIARQLVEAHGGAIEAASSPGGGTLISFELPLATPEP